MFEGRRRIVAAVGMALLLAIAGCGGGGGGATPTDAGGGSTPTETAVEQRDLPRGITESGKVRVLRVVATHSKALGEESYTLDISVERTVRARGQTRNSSAQQLARVGPDGQFLTEFEQTGTTRFGQTTWGNDSLAVSRVERGGEVSYRRPNASQVQSSLPGNGFLEQFLRMGNYSVENVDREAGRITLTAENPSNVQPGMGQEATIEAYDDTVVVDFEGRIHSVDADVQIATGNGGTVDLAVAFELSALGETSVQRPDWVSEALSESTASPR